jgi:hypothetical protein|tara:strand:+ start:246 stop:431 length:186 start_codon:yes stop_codon:yes gene_type:complete
MNEKEEDKLIVGLKEVLENDIKKIEQLQLDMKLNFCLNDALDLISEHGEDWFMLELRKRLH